MKKKVCKNCKIFVEGKSCPICKGSQFGTTWKGRIHIIDANKSEIAKKLAVTIKGEYGIKV
ncbi:MAG: transcription elongation factor subunit Spt4 [Candidatus Woesearchaeota archaeon]